MLNELVKRIHALPDNVVFEIIMHMSLGNFKRAVVNWAIKWSANISCDEALCELATICGIKFMDINNYSAIKKAHCYINAEEWRIELLKTTTSIFASRYEYTFYGAEAYAKNAKYREREKNTRVKFIAGEVA